MQAKLNTIGSSALMSILLILPLMIMEVVNRRSYHEDFPLYLFLIMWLNLFAVSLILLPIVQGRRRSTQNMANPVTPQGTTLLTNPKSALLVSIVLLLCPVTLFLLASLGWGERLNRLFNGPNPEVTYLPGMIMSLGLYLLPAASGIIAGRPIVTTLRAGGSLFAHPLNLIIVAFILSTFVLGFATLLIDQWPCFIGVPNCD